MSIEILNNIGRCCTIVPLFCFVLVNFKFNLCTPDNCYVIRIPEDEALYGFVLINLSDLIYLDFFVGASHGGNVSGNKRCPDVYNE